MKSAGFVALVAVVSFGCARTESPSSKPAAPAPQGMPTLVLGLPLPWGTTVGLKRAQVAGAYLAKALDAHVDPRLFSYGDLAKALDAGQVDIALLPPFGYVLAAAGGRVRLVRRAKHDGVATYRSILFVRKDSGISSLADLKGKSVAWVREGSASGNLFPRAYLLEHHLDPATFFSSQEVLASHSDVCRAVFDGKVAAGASFTDAWNDFDHATIDGCVPALGANVKELQILFATDPIPNDVIAVSSRLRAGLVARLGAVLDAMSTTPEGRRALADGFASQGFVPVADVDFDPVREALSVLRPPPTVGADAGR